MSQLRASQDFNFHPSKPHPHDKKTNEYTSDYTHPKKSSQRSTTSHSSLRQKSPLSKATPKPLQSRNSKSLTSSSTLTKGNIRNKELLNKIENDIEFLLENPLNLRKFKSLLENIRNKQNKQKSDKYSKDFILKNIDISKSLHCRRKTSCGDRMEKVKNRRYYQEQVSRERIIINNKRWEIFRKRRDQERQRRVEEKMKRSRLKHIVILFNMKKVVNVLNHQCKQKKEEMIFKFLEKFAITKIMKNYERKMIAYGPSLHDRDVTRIRHSFNFLQNFQTDWQKEKAAGCVFRLLDELALRKELRERFINYTKMVEKIQIWYKERVKVRKEAEQRKVWEEARKLHKKKRSKKSKNRKHSKISHSSISSRKPASPLKSRKYPLLTYKEPKSAIFLSEVP